MEAIQVLIRVLGLDSRERVPDEHIGLQSKIRLKINHWRLSPEPPELAGFYVDSVRECVRKLAAGRRSVRLASNSSAGSGFTRPPGSLESEEANGNCQSHDGTYHVY